MDEEADAADVEDDVVADGSSDGWDCRCEPEPVSGLLLMLPVRMDAANGARRGCAIVTGSGLGRGDARLSGGEMTSVKCSLAASASALSTASLDAEDEDILVGVGTGIAIGGPPIEVVVVVVVVPLGMDVVVVVVVGKGLGLDGGVSGWR